MNTKGAFLKKASTAAGADEVLPVEDCAAVCEARADCRGFAQFRLMRNFSRGARRLPVFSYGP